MGIRLRVSESSRQDTGRYIARVSEYVLEKLKIRAGSIVKIYGRKRAIAMKVWPHKNAIDTIKLDGISRRVLGIGLNDTIEIEPLEEKEIERIVLVPINANFPLETRFSNFLKSRLVGTPALVDSILYVVIVNKTSFFRVSEIFPPDGNIIVEKTKLILGKRVVGAEVPVPGVSYDDIGGLREVIQRIREIVEIPMKYPEVFKKLGVEPPKGIILYGPPGCGKTLIARALANEVDAKFFAINGPEIMSKFYGESEKKLRDIFAEAEKYTPSIIFIDELDSIAPRREESSREVENRIVAQLLTLMDGIKQRGKIIVIGATNRVNAIDPALRRPGRFDKEIEVKVPDENGRREILQIHTRGMPLAPDVDLSELAKLTYGFTGADLAALCQEAALVALRRLLPELEKGASMEVIEKLTVTRQDFMEALKNITPSAIREVFVDISDVKWEDVKGYEKIKEKLLEIVLWMREHYDELKKEKIPLPTGILLYGPPGCGKTFLIKALANKTRYNLIYVRGPEVYSKWLGESERAIRELFKKAKQVAPSILFVDNIETIISHRTLEGYRGLHISEQFLVSLEDIHRYYDVFVIGATNRPDLIDRAALRPGRFDKIIYVPPPSREDRFKILKGLIKEKLDASEIEELVALTENFSCADLVSLYQTAIIKAIKNKEKLSKEHFLEALKEVPPSLNSQIIEFYRQFKSTLIGRPPPGSSILEITF